MNVLMETDIPGYSCRRGKVRDVYDVGSNLVIISTDRLSAFDVVMREGVPDKGVVLTKLTQLWFSRLSEITAPHHFISASLKDCPEPFRRPELEGRTMFCLKAEEVVRFECIVRGYLAGSGWQDYQNTGCVCGIKLPPGLQNCAKLPEPIFTPSTKAETGHDENVPFERMQDELNHLAVELRDWSLTLYKEAHNYASERGIIIADTKFEFGMVDGKPMLIDEVLTPDSSRFWPADTYQSGKSQPSLDKQGVRDYLQGLCDAGRWSKQPPPPPLPPWLVKATRNKYLRIYRLLNNGKGLQ